MTEEGQITTTAESEHKSERDPEHLAEYGETSPDGGDNPTAHPSSQDGAAMVRTGSGNDGNDGTATREGSQLGKDDAAIEPTDTSRPETPIDLHDLRAASPASNASGSTTGIARASSTTPGITSTAPKKFSSMNINKKFLGKTAVVAPTATAPNFGGLGMKPGLGSLGGVHSMFTVLAVCRGQLIR